MQCTRPQPPASSVRLATIVRCFLNGLDATQSVCITGSSGAGGPELASNIVRVLAEASRQPVKIHEIRRGEELDALVKARKKSTSSEVPTAEIVILHVDNISLSPVSIQSLYLLFTHAAINGSPRQLIVGLSQPRTTAGSWRGVSFEETISILSPTPIERTYMLNLALTLLQVPHTLSFDEMKQIGELCRGCMWCDIRSITLRAYGFVGLDGSTNNVALGWPEVEKAVKHSLGRKVANAGGNNIGRKADFEGGTAIGTGEIEKAQWSDVGGLDKAKQLLQNVLPVTRPELQRLGIKRSKGALLYGPPGTGKTLLLRSLLSLPSSAGITFLPLSIPHLIHGSVGESEKTIIRTFTHAMRHAPAVIFIDELEAMFGRRDEMGNVGKGVLTALIGQLDALNTQNEPVSVIGATNWISKVEWTLLRPGRLDTLIPVSPPGSHARATILKSLLRNVQLDEDVDLAALAQEFRCTGAELKEGVRRAVVKGAGKVGMTELLDGFRHLATSQE
ncbi:P-loop containing nucleoside triphosphate hydrolase protein [Gaertneriomyces semiglobifer]|nr:P-loop containing nucleoside triphosphate hydrolase protein [Gaertneriomyces semiglobifer]